MGVAAIHCVAAPVDQPTVLPAFWYVTLSEPDAAEWQASAAFQTRLTNVSPHPANEHHANEDSLRGGDSDSYPSCTTGRHWVKVR